MKIIIGIVFAALIIPALLQGALFVAFILTVIGGAAMAAAGDMEKKK